MNLEHNYWYFESALSEDFCDNLIKYGNEQREQLAITGGIGKDQGKPRDIEQNPLTEEEKKNLLKKRNSNITWLSDRWIYDMVHPFVHTANKNAGWNFQWDYAEACQFTKYKLNQYYEWHQDAWDKPYTELVQPEFIGKCRKLSVTCSLSAPKDYKGGQLEFSTLNGDKQKIETKECKEILPRGSIVVFPSFIWHRVKAVTEGTRYSLVLWQLGLPFK